jgi:hypothetical protein
LVLSIEVISALKKIKRSVKGFPLEVIVFSNYFSDRISINEEGEVLSTRNDNCYDITPKQFVDRAIRTVNDLRVMPPVDDYLRKLIHKKPRFYDHLETWIPAIAKAMFLEDTDDFGDSVELLYSSQR